MRGETQGVDSRAEVHEVCGGYSMFPGYVFQIAAVHRVRDARPRVGVLSILGVSWGMGNSPSAITVSMTAGIVPLTNRE